MILPLSRYQNNKRPQGYKMPSKHPHIVAFPLWVVGKGFVVKADVRRVVGPQLLCGFGRVYT